MHQSDRRFRQDVAVRSKAVIGLFTLDHVRAVEGVTDGSAIEELGNETLLRDKLGPAWLWLRVNIVQIAIDTIVA